LDADAPRPPAGSAILPFPAPLQDVVRHAARAMLELAGGNKSEAARRLGISRPRLQRLLDGEMD
jgi:DNA-binding NtrC family response regulator